jgi:hypothetical protein
MRSAETPAASDLVREAALDLGHLVGHHLKVARLEFKVELHTMGRRLLVLAALTAVVAVGYTLAMAGLALVIGGNLALGIPFSAIGVSHVVGAVVGLLIVPGRKGASHLMSTSTTAMNDSLQALKERAAPSVEEHHAR